MVTKSSRRSGEHKPQRTNIMPYTNIFKEFKVMQGHAKKQGGVTEQLERGPDKRPMNKQVWKIDGVVNANNFLQVPHPIKVRKGLEIVHDFLYIQMAPLPGKVFVTHLDFHVGEKVSPFRVSFGNLYSKSKVLATGCQYSIQPKNWTIICLHIPTLLSKYSKLTCKSHSLKSITCCSSQMGDHSDCYDWMEIPANLTEDLSEQLALQHVEESVSPHATAAKSAMERKSMIPRVPIMERVALKPNVGLPLAKADEGGNDRPQLTIGLSPSPDIIMPFTPSCDLPERLGPMPVHPPTPPGGHEGVLATAEYAGSTGKKAVRPIFPDPLFDVEHFSGVPGYNLSDDPAKKMTTKPIAFWVSKAVPQGNKTEREIREQTIMYAAASTLVWCNPKTKEQKCFFGHTQPIVLIQASDCGSFIASAQNAAPNVSACVRIHKIEDDEPCKMRCFGMINCQDFVAITSVAFDPSNKFVAVAGDHVKVGHQIYLWDIHRAVDSGKIQMIAAQRSDFAFSRIRFSPFEEMKLVSCGKENIRFWRVQDQHLPGSCVQLGHMARGFHFTDLAFEAQKLEPNQFLGDKLQRHHRVFIACLEGKVIQLSYEKREIKSVSSLHDGPIYSICANEGFVATASGDKKIRVWPLDLGTMYMHAEHPSEVIGVDISVDGCAVLCSTTSGSIGILDIVEKQYDTIGLCHHGEITACAIADDGKDMATVSRDGLLKCWDVETLLQTWEFKIDDGNGDVGISLCYHPNVDNEKVPLLAAGFESGSVNILDLKALAKLHEFTNHAHPVCDVAFHYDIITKEFEDGARTKLPRTFIISADAAGVIFVGDSKLNFQVVRNPQLVPCEPLPMTCTSLAFAYGASPVCLRYLDAHSVMILRLPFFERQEGTLRTGASTISCFSLAPVGEIEPKYAVIGTNDSRVKIFCLKTCRLLHEVMLMDGPVTCATLGSLQLPEPYTDRAILMTMANSKHLKISEIHSSMLEPKDRDDSRSIAPSPTRINEQRFTGHSVPAFKFLFSKDQFITVSGSEMMAWQCNAKHYLSLIQEKFTTEMREFEENKSDLQITDAPAVKEDVTDYTPAGMSFTMNIHNMTRRPEVAPISKTSSMIQAELDSIKEKDVVMSKEGGEIKGNGSGPKPALWNLLEEIREIVPDQATLRSQITEEHKTIPKAVIPENSAAMSSEPPQSIIDHLDLHRGRKTLLTEPSISHEVHEILNEAERHAEREFHENIYNLPPPVMDGNDYHPPVTATIINDGNDDDSEIASTLPPEIENEYKYSMPSPSPLVSLEPEELHAIITNPLEPEELRAIITNKTVEEEPERKVISPTLAEVAGCNVSRPQGCWWSYGHNIMAHCVGCFVSVSRLDKAVSSQEPSRSSLLPLKSGEAIAVDAKLDTHLLAVMCAPNNLVLFDININKKLAEITLPSAEYTSSGFSSWRVVVTQNRILTCCAPQKNGTVGGQMDIWHIDETGGVSHEKSCEIGIPVALLEHPHVQEEFVTVAESLVVIWRYTGGVINWQTIPTPEKSQFGKITCGANALIEERNTIAIGTEKGAVFMFDLDRLGEWRKVYESTSKTLISTLALSTDGYLFVGLEDRSNVYRRDVKGKLNKPQEEIISSSTSDGLVELDGPVCAIFCDGSSDKVLACSSHNTIWMADFVMGIRIYLHGFHTSPVGILATNYDLIAPGSDSGVIVTGDENGAVRVWSKDTSGRFWANTDFSAGCPCFALTFHTADLLVGGYEDGYLRIFSLEAKKCITKVPVCFDALNCLDTSSNGIVLGTCEGSVYTVSLVAAQGSPSISEARVIKAAQGPSDGRGVTCIASRSRTKHFLSAFDSGEIWIWKEKSTYFMSTRDISAEDVGEILSTWVVRPCNEDSRIRVPPLTATFLSGNRICGIGGTSTIGIYDFERCTVLQSVSLESTNAWVTQLLPGFDNVLWVIQSDGKALLFDQDNLDQIEDEDGKKVVAHLGARSIRSSWGRACLCLPETPTSNGGGVWIAGFGHCLQRWTTGSQSERWSRYQS